MKAFIDKPLAGTLHRILVAASYASAIAGVAYFVIGRFAFDMAKKDNRIAETSRAVVDGPFLGAGIACLGFGLLAFLIGIALALGAERDPARRLRVVTLLTWVPWIAVLCTLLASVLHK